MFNGEESPSTYIYLSSWPTCITAFVTQCHDIISKKRSFGLKCEREYTDFIWLSYISSEQQAGRVRRGFQTLACSRRSMFLSQLIVTQRVQLRTAHEASRARAALFSCVVFPPVGTGEETAEAPRCTAAVLVSSIGVGAEERRLYVRLSRGAERGSAYQRRRSRNSFSVAPKRRTGCKTAH